MNAIESISPTLLGERLRIARSNAGLTQDAAAGIIDVSRPTLIAIEQGQRRVRGDELRKLAAAYNVSVNELLRETAVHVDLVGKFRKSRPGSAVDDPSEGAIQLLNRLAAASIELESRLGGRKQPQPLPERAIAPGDLEQQAEDLALEMRHRLGLGQAPVVDIVSLLELELGIRVFVRPLPQSISGVFAYDPVVGPCILVNSEHPRDRQVLTILHELGHYLCTRETPDVVIQSERESSREERFVTQFAVAFLMPAAAIRRRFREFAQSDGSFTLRGLVLMAHAFGVSFEALTRRLEGLKLIRRGTFESLKARGFAIEEARRSLGLEIPPLSTATPRISILAVEAHRKGILSEGQLSKMLALDQIQIREMLDTLGGEEFDDEIPVEP